MEMTSCYLNTVVLCDMIEEILTNILEIITG